MSSSIYFKGPGIKITDSGMQIKGISYTRNDIQSVSVEEKSMSSGQRIGAAVVGFVLLGMVALLSPDATYCGAPLAILGLAAIGSAIIGVKTYVLKVMTLTGDVTALSTTNQRQAHKAEEALERCLAQIVQPPPTNPIDPKQGPTSVKDAIEEAMFAPAVTQTPSTPATATDSIAERNGPETDAGDRLGAYVAELPDVSDEKVNKLLNGLQDRMAYKREAALNEIGREKLTDQRIVGAVKILAASDRVDTIREIAQRVLDSLDLAELRNDTGEEPAVMPAAIPSSPAMSTNPGARSHQTTPRLLILLVDKMPPGGPEAHIRRMLNDLPAQEIPEDVTLKVTDSYADEGYIAVNATFAPLQQGIRVDEAKTWYRSYSTADGARGTQIFIYE